MRREKLKEPEDEVVYRRAYGGPLEKALDEHWLVEVTRIQPWTGVATLYAMPGHIKVSHVVLPLQFDANPRINHEDAYWVENWAQGEIEKYGP